MARFTGKISLSFNDIVIIPGRQKAGIKPEDVDLGIYIGDIHQPVSWFSAAMQCVGGYRDGDDLGGYKLNIGLAQHGCCPVLPRSLSIEDEVEIGKRIKREKAGFNYDVVTVYPDMLIGDLMEISRKGGHSLYPVIDDKGKLLGLITEKKYHPGKDRNVKVKDRMILRYAEGDDEDRVIVGREEITLKEANERLLRKGIGILPIVDRDNNYRCSVFYDDIRRHVDFPKEFVDDKGRYRYAGAVSTYDEDFERAEELVKAGCDILCVDTSDAKSDHASRMIKKFKKLGVPIIAGNVIDREGFNILAEAGADAVKGGQGPGYGCTTRHVKGSGRGQITVGQELVAARDSYKRRKKRYIPIILDGGIEGTGEMMKSYAIDVDGVMMGKYFGEFTESAAPLVRLPIQIQLPQSNLREVEIEFKKYWGEGSKMGMNLQRYGYDRAAGFIPEGKERLITHRGSIYGVDGLQPEIDFVRKTISESGAKNHHKYSKRIMIEQQSSATAGEGAKT